jgi:stage II sporulation protein D
MNMKIKLVIIGICVVIVFVVGTININQKINEQKTGGHNFISVEDDVITKAEAYRLLSYLYYDKAAREALAFDITYSDEQMSGWYDTYVNAIYHMGLIEKDIAKNPEEALTYGTCKILMDNLILKEPDFQTIYKDLSFEFTNQDKDMEIADFLEIYQAILSDEEWKKENTSLKEETLLVLGKDTSENNPVRMITNQGKYYYANTADYNKYLSADSSTQVQNKDTSKGAAGEITGAVNEGAAGITTGAGDEGVTGEISGDVSTGVLVASTGDTVVGKTGEVTGAADTEAKDATEETDTANEDKATGLNEAATNLVDRYMDQGITVLTCGKEIVYVTGISKEEIILHNVWIKKGESSTLEVFVNEVDKTFTTQYKLSENLEKVIGDITIKNKIIVQLSVKPDMIKGKVLQIGDDFIEVEGYGKLPLDEHMKIYKIYNTLSEEPSTSILVGYENTSFIVSEGKVNAALITENIKAENIRVLLTTTNYKEKYHPSIKFTGTGKFTVTAGDTTETYKKGDVVTIKEGDELFKDGRIVIEPVAEEGKMKVLSIKRSCGSPMYRGRIEISKEDAGLIIINELPLEEYLYAVLPSEMPTSYGTEALKVQALCARSYAFKQLLSNGMSAYGAHVDDSTSYQVYNNLAENENSILAVKETYGKVIEYNGEVISAYYFSTSSGHTASVSEVWANSKELPYIKGKLLVNADGQGDAGDSQVSKEYSDLSSDKSFRSFIESKDLLTTDKEFNWYRWEVTISAKNLKKVIDANLKKRYEASPGLILTKDKDVQEEKYISEPVDTVGSIVDIQVIKRESSGIVSEILIMGSENTIKVRSEYNIRTLLAPLYDKIVRLDETTVEKMSLLPSAFFALDATMKKDKLSSITLKGGGYGHGVGLSQNGVKALAEQGVNYEDIVSFFYKDIDIGFIYE